jgi:hypothetical protein
MTTPTIAGVVPAALKGQLSADGSGVNERLIVLGASYVFDPFQFDWSDMSVNTMMGSIDPASLEETSVFTYPFLTIDLLALQDAREIKYSTFSGPAVGIVEVHHSWPDESIIADFGALVNATADAVLSCLNDAKYQDWPDNLLWNGRAEMRPGRLKQGGLGWLKTTQFICPFRLTV